MKTKKIKPQVGDIFEVPLGGEQVMYGHVLDWGMMGFYATAGKRLTLEEIVTHDVAMKFGVVLYALEDGTFPIIGNMPPPPAMMTPVSFWRQTAPDFIFKYTWNGKDTKNEQRVSEEEIKGLEKFGSWSPEWTIERLQCFLRGEPSPRLKVR